MTLQDTLNERGTVHGDFTDNARISQSIKSILRAEPSYAHLTPVMREALDMIAHKMARILAGNPNHPDHVHDIQGYARLVEERLP